MADRRVLIGALSGAFALGVTIALIGALESWINQDLAVPHALTGLAQSALYAGNLLGSLATGWLMYKLNPRRLGLLALAVMMAGSAVSGVRSYEMVVAGRLLTGLGYAGAAIFFNAAIVRAYPQRQATYLNLYHATFAFSAAATLLAGRLMGDALGGWPALFWLAGAMCLLPMGVFAFARPSSIIEGEPFTWRSLARTVRIPAIALTLVLMALYTMSEQSLTVFVGSFAQQEIGLPAAGAALVSALLWLGVLTGRLLSAAASRRVSEPLQLAVCLGGMAGLMLVGLGGRRDGLYGVMFLIGVCAGPAVPLMFSYASRGTDRLKGAVLALCNVSNCVGGILGPMAVGAIGDRASLQAGLTASAGLLLAGVIPYLWAARRQAHRAQPSSPAAR
jgi:predicted MFS family arabinose efflux permease